MMAAVWLFLRSHWQIAAGVGALAAAFAGGWLAHRPPPAPAVVLTQASASGAASSSTAATHVEQGPVDRTTDRTTYFGDDAQPTVQLLPGTPGAAKPRACPPARVVEHIVEHQGPVATDTKTAAQQTSHAEQKLQLKLTPQDQPRTMLWGGYQVSPERRVVIAVSVRSPDLPFIGPVWGQVQLAPRLSDPLKSPVTLLLGKAF